MHALLRPSLRRLSLLAVALGATIVVTTGVSSAAPGIPARAPTGDPAALPPEASARAVARAVARADALSRAIGLPSGSHSVQRITDPSQRASFDEVTTRDDRGRPTAIMRLTTDGRLALAVALGLHESASSIDAGRATQLAEHLVSVADVPPQGSSRATKSSGAGGWIVSWPRVVDGAPVRGDGIRVGLWTDGAVHSISRSEQALAPRPAIVAPEDRARAAAAATVSSGFGTAAGDLREVRASLAWLSPNEAFGAAPGPASGVTTRLAWVVEFRATGALADRLTAIEIWLDAGTLAIIGGDVAE
ncbi:MAG TPA: hypothetical protein VFI28_06655 [Candidatus Limnocylindrales bacterium]|nr:hypothetical protein [Candidatus Limnocylindrales bacterium]